MPVAAGTLHLRLTDTLLELSRTQRSGILRIERGAFKKQLVLIQGLLAFAESNVPEEHLAQVLLKTGLIPRKELKTIAAHMKSGKSSEEAIILATGLNGDGLMQGVREQAIVILASLFAWPEADMRIFSGEESLRRRCNAAIPLPQALVEAARFAVKNRGFPEAIQSLKGQVRADTAAGMRASFPLSSAEAYAYAQAGSPTPVEQLLQVLPRGEGKPENVVQCLLLLGLLRLESQSSHLSSVSAGVRTLQLSEQIDEMLLRFEVANLYEILSVPPDAREEDIKAAYHEMARLYHPDRFHSKEYSAALRTRAEELFTYITGAYTTLSNAASRALYDETRIKKESQVEASLQARAVIDLEKEKMAETLFRVGRNALMRRDFDTAVRQLKECVWLIPDAARFHHYLGVAQAEIAAYRKEAEQHLLKAIALDRMNSDSYLELGKLYLKVNLPSRAEAQFREGLRWDPENEELLQMLDEVAMKKGAW